MKDRKQLYFIGIIPPSPVFEKIQEIKHYVSEKYNCFRALKSPPHITLVPPFKYVESKEYLLIEKIQSFSIDEKIIISIHNYDCFYPKVVFINVEKINALNNLYHRTSVFVQDELQIEQTHKYPSFHPHITIAFKDIDLPLTMRIYDDLQNNFPINITFEVNKISLLKHTGKIWEIIV